MMKGDNSIVVYENAGSTNRYRRQGEVQLKEINGKPVSIANDEDGTIKVVSSIRMGDKLTQHEEVMYEDFIEHLKSFGGEWMWEHLEIGDDLTWLANAIQEGTAVAVTDGSYNKKLAPNISGAGWIIRCKASGKEVRGSFSEYSTSAGSYRGELLGTLAINTFLLAIEEYYQPHKNETVVFCDNKGAVYTFSKKDEASPFRRKTRRYTTSKTVRRSKNEEHIETQACIWAPR